jgi:biopolymer transport protein ExbD
MKFRSNSPDQPELNLIPMIDVLLMTLIFLVVTTSFSKEAQLHIKLPESSAEAKVDDASLRITIDAKGHYFINDKQLLNDTFEVLRRTMLEAAGSNRSPVVVIYADAKTPHQAVVRAMDTARRLGYTHLTFATQQYSSDSALP